MPVLTINRKLNVALPPIETEKGLVYVYASPIMMPTFRDSYKILGRAYTAIQTLGFGALTGPGLAAYVLRDEAKLLGEEAQCESLMNEIRRLAQVIRMKDSSWDPVPLVEAVRMEVLSEEQIAEVENILVYFTCASWIRLPDEAQAISGLQILWHVQTLSSSLMDYLRSLPTSTQGENTGEKPTTPQEKTRLSIPA
jgi:hypothetical protein